MNIQGIDEVTFAATDLPKCRQFFQDWGLSLVSEAPQELVFESLNGCRVVVAHSDKPGLPAGIEPDPTLREVVWGVADAQTLATLGARLADQPGFVQDGQRVGCQDPNGLALRLPPLLGVSAAELESQFHFNVTTAFALTKAATPHLLTSGGSVINISSAIGRLRDRGFVGYGTAKAALLAAIDLALGRTAAPQAERVPCAGWAATSERAL